MSWRCARSGGTSIWYGDSSFFNFIFHPAAKGVRQKGIGTLNVVNDLIAKIRRFSPGAHLQYFGLSGSDLKSEGDPYDFLEIASQALKTPPIDFRRTHLGSPFSCSEL